MRTLPPMDMGRRKGFSVTELLVVCGIVITVCVIAVPQLLTALRTGKVRGANSDYAGLLQTARLRAVNDDRYYSVYTQTAQGNTPQLAYVDIYPQNADGTSGTGSPASGGSYTPGPPADPMVPISAEVIPQPQAAAPNMANLLAGFCSTCTVGILHNSAPTFGPSGMPCTPTAAASGGTVCNSTGGPTAYAQFFQSQTTQEWDAVTVTPAGRIQMWYYTGTVWAALN